ncbi:MAG: hypothetical protein H7Y22_17780 [Gemmatimonadaceae bacterium]|nr:hypothetical protein [Gloeobacterales cyanobacterium ES-bin-141]
MMDNKIKRRQFGKLVLASTAVTTSLGHLGSKASAQTSTIVYGADIVSDALVLKSMDLTSGLVQDLSALTSTLKLKSKERLTGLSAANSSSFTLSSTYKQDKKSNANNLYLLSTSAKTLKISGLGAKDTLESLIVATDGSLLGLLSRNGGSPPFSLAKFDKNGKASILVQFPLPPDWRFSNLTQHPNGTIYATSMQRDGHTRLVRIDLQKRQLVVLKSLRFEDRTLRNDVFSMTCSAAGELHVLSNPVYEENSSVFSTDVSTGSIKKLKPFTVGKISFAL